MSNNTENPRMTCLTCGGSNCVGNPHGTSYVPIETTAEATSIKCRTCKSPNQNITYPIPSGNPCRNSFHGTGTVQPSSDFSKFAHADEATKRPIIERAIKAANQDQREAVQPKSDTTEPKSQSKSQPKSDTVAETVAYSGDRQLIHKWLGGQSSDIIDRIDDMELLLEILKICERRRG